MKKILITGVGGFVSSHLINYILKEQKDCEIAGIYRRHGVDSLQRLKEFGTEDKIKLYEGDLTSYNRVWQILKDFKPDIIFHLAAQSFVKVSWETPEHTLTNNIVSQLNIFEAVKKLELDPVIQIAGSSEEYGMVTPDECPMKETNDLKPLSPYGVSKIAQDKMAYQYYKSYGLKTVITRAFNHEGPGRGKEFVTSAFASQIADIEINNKPAVIEVGNLEAERDFTDVRDMVRAYWLAVNKCEHGEAYNIGSGEAHKISEVLEALVGASNIEGLKVNQNPDLMRPSDVPLLLADCTKFQKVTGWKPEISFEKMLADQLEYWKNKV